jgi:hypothetical protein
MADRIRQLAISIDPAPCRPAYEHAGALLADTILQAGVRYTTVVVPRVRSILEQFPMANTIPLFLELLHLEGACAVLQWKDAEKPSRLLGLVTFLEAEGLHTVADLSAWLLIRENLATLQSLRGIGPKTVDYIQQLAGISRVAVDRHLLGFIAAAGIRTSAYDEASDLVESTASILGVSAIALDRAIWRYQSIRH